MVVGFLTQFKDLHYLSLDNKKYGPKVQDLIVTITKEATKLEIMFETCAALFISKQTITTTQLENLKCTIYNRSSSRTSSTILFYFRTSKWTTARERESADIDGETDGYYINWLDGCFDSFKWWAHRESILKFTTFIQHQASRNQAQFFCQSSRQTRSPVAPPPTTTTTTKKKKQFKP